MRYHWIVNPAAGRRNAVPFAQRIAARLVERGHAADWHAPASAADARRHVAGLAAGDFDVLGVVGGDGTLAALLESRPGGLPWPVALAPMGTANLVARELRMPFGLDAQATVEALERGVPWPVDLVGISGPDAARRRAIANVGVGPDAAVVQAIDGLRAGASGSGSYRRWVRPILETLGDMRLPRLRVVLDGRRAYAATACVVQNAHNYGGVFRLAPDAGLASGALDVVLLAARTRLDLARVLVRALLRRAPHDAGVRLLKAEEVSIEADGEVPAQADGDGIGHAPLQLKRLARAATLWRAV